MHLIYSLVYELKLIMTCCWIPESQKSGVTAMFLCLDDGVWNNITNEDI